MKWFLSVLAILLMFSMHSDIAVADGRICFLLDRAAVCPSGSLNPAQEIQVNSAIKGSGTNSVSGLHEPVNTSVNAPRPQVQQMPVTPSVVRPSTPQQESSPGFQNQNSARPNVSPQTPPDRAGTQETRPINQSQDSSGRMPVPAGKDNLSAEPSQPSQANKNQPENNALNNQGRGNQGGNGQGQENQRQGNGGGTEQRTENQQPGSQGGNEQRTENQETNEQGTLNAVPGNSGNQENQTTAPTANTGQNNTGTETTLQSKVVTSGTTDSGNTARVETTTNTSTSTTQTVAPSTLSTTQTVAPSTLSTTQTVAPSTLSTTQTVVPYTPTTNTVNPVPNTQRIVSTVNTINPAPNTQGSTDQKVNEPVVNNGDQNSPNNGKPQTGTTAPPPNEKKQAPPPPKKPAEKKEEKKEKKSENGFEKGSGSAGANGFISEDAQVYSLPFSYNFNSWFQLSVSIPYIVTDEAKGWGNSLVAGKFLTNLTPDMSLLTTMGLYTTSGNVAVGSRSVIDYQFSQSFMWLYSPTVYLISYSALFRPVDEDLLDKGDIFSFFVGLDTPAFWWGDYLSMYAAFSGTSTQEDLLEDNGLGNQRTTVDTILGVSFYRWNFRMGITLPTYTASDEIENSDRSVAFDFGVRFTLR
ncbi:MAG: hypothetical protein HQM12_20725 [SAR324 cluster bacterium]|nr:hypothetical protein [SAR324 cluster bacterium]